MGADKQWMTLTAERADREADEIVSLVLAREDGGTLPGWEPGAHIEVSLPSGLYRQYSLCGDPSDRQRYRIAVLREEAGRGGSAELHGLAEAGQRFTVGVPKNNFRLDEAERYLFLAGGVGITPILPMIERADASGAEWRLVYGGRCSSSMAFLERIGRYPGQRAEVWPEDEHGRPDLGAELAAVTAETLVYACGPAGMLSAIAEEHSRCQVSCSLRVERFAADGPADTTGEQLEVVLSRSDKTITVPARSSVLESVRGVLPDVSFSCEEGYCGECETQVLDGVPDHRDSYLTESEREAGDTMMICVSRCRGDRLVLDL